jgi:subtilase family serine protease
VKDLTFTIGGEYVFAGRSQQIIVKADGTDKVAEIRETNNTSLISFLIETRPDLIVKEITLSPKPAAKKPLTIYFKISNIGASTTSAGAGVQVATVFVDGKVVGTVPYNDVPKGGLITGQLLLSSGIATAGVHKIKVSADTNKIVEEINENNNSLEKSFPIAK